MRAMRSTPANGLAGALLSVLLFGASGCGSSPMDMWINKDPDAGSDFEAPVREAGTRSDGAPDTNDAADDGAGGTGGGGAGGGAGDTGSGGGGAGGESGAGGGGAGGQ